MLIPDNSIQSLARLHPLNHDCEVREKKVGVQLAAAAIPDMIVLAERPDQDMAQTAVDGTADESLERVESRVLHFETMVIALA